MKKREEDELLENIGAGKVVLSNARWRDPFLAAVRPLLVGEANPYGGRPDMALYPHPEGSAGHRLCVKILGMERAAYLRDFDRVNLCGAVWRPKEARARALAILKEGRPMVLLGTRVCRAFQVKFEPFSVNFGVSAKDGLAMGLRCPVAVLPHPSGLCRLWNRDGSYEAARDAVQRLMAGP